APGPVPFAVPLPPTVRPPAPAVRCEPSVPTCPFLKMQKAADRFVPPVDEIEMGDSVLENLKKLRKADHLVKKAKELGQRGDVYHALECLEQAGKLCP